MKITKKVDGLATIAFLAGAVPAPPIVASEALPNQPFAEQSDNNDQNGEKPLSFTFCRSSGGITQIAIEPLRFPNTYVTMVTASGPTGDEAAIAAAILLTFTNLDPQTSFAGTGSITYFYNQSKPSYVISELERAKLIFPAEAAAVRTAFEKL
jgi:hypothetical protein